MKKILGLLSGYFNSQSQQTPSVPSVLPQTARNQIMQNVLPNLNVDKLILKSGEFCHYVDKAIYEKRIVNKHYVRHNQGISMPGIFQGNRVHFGGGETQVEDQVSYQSIKGYLFVTNARIVFVGKSEGFEEIVSDIVAITPYSNCVIMQFKKNEYKVFVPDGNIVNQVVRMIV